MTFEETVRSQNNHLASMITPIHRLPNEIIAEILLNDDFDSLNDDLDSLDDDLDSSIAPPMGLRRRDTLRLTCARWNNIIENTPQFWAYLSLNSSEVETLETRAVDLGMINLISNRSADLSLSVVLLSIV
jgi:hypothetical protein